MHSNNILRLFRHRVICHLKIFAETLLWFCGSAGSLSVFELSSRDHQATWKQKFLYRLESLQVTAFVTFATFLALFMDDFRLACLPSSLDDTCQYISLAVGVRVSHSTHSLSSLHLPDIAKLTCLETTITSWNQSTGGSQRLTTGSTTAII